MDDTPARHWQRRRFLHAVSVALPGAAMAACTDEPVTATQASSTSTGSTGEPTPTASDHYAAIVEAYFGADGVADAVAIGDFRARQADPAWSAMQAFESTRELRLSLDAIESVADAVVMLEQRLAEDFAELRVLDLDGWTLGMTEVALCVLAAVI